MIQSARISMSGEIKSLGTILSSTDRFTKVRIKCFSGSVVVGDSDIGIVDDPNGFFLTANSSNPVDSANLYLEFDFRDDPANNLYIAAKQGTSGSCVVLAW